VGTKQKSTEIAKRANLDIDGQDKRVTKFYPEHLRIWVNEESDRLMEIRRWIAVASMDAAGLPIAEGHWMVIERKKGLPQ